MCQTLSNSYWFNGQHVPLAWSRPLRKLPKYSSDKKGEIRIWAQGADFVVLLGLRTGERSLYLSDTLT